MINFIKRIFGIDEFGLGHKEERRATGWPTTESNNKSWGTSGYDRHFV